MIFIKLADKNDCLKAAQIHFQEIKYGFLAELGEKFLYCFYQAMVDSENAFLIIAKDNDSVIGFISGCTNLKKFYRDFAERHFFKILPVLFKKLFSFSSLKKILETRKYGKEKKSDLPEAELISIAVAFEFQGKGVALQLLDGFFFEMRKRKINSIKVIVGEKLIKAIRFYEKNGFKFHSKSFVHRDIPSRVYLYNLKSRLI